VTFATKSRWVLPHAARDAVLECCRKRHKKEIELHVAVVMPDHVHLIFTPLRRDDAWPYPLPDIMHAIKGSSARQVNLLLGRTGPVWQEEFFDHLLRSNESLAEKVEYVCQNPVRAGLVKSENDYCWLWKSALPVV